MRRFCVSLPYVRLCWSLWSRGYSGLCFVVCDFVAYDGQFGDDLILGHVIQVFEGTDTVMYWFVCCYLGDLGFGGWTLRGLRRYRMVGCLVCDAGISESGNLLHVDEGIEMYFFCPFYDYGKVGFAC